MEQTIIKNLFDSYLAGDFIVDSGQWVIFKAEDWGITNKKFAEKRIPVHKPTGKIIPKSYLWCWGQAIEGIEFSLNELMKRGELEMHLEPLSQDLDYQSCCDITCHTEKGAGFLKDCQAFVSATCYGDGIYPIFKHNDGKGFHITTGHDDYDNLQLSVTQNVFIDWQKQFLNTKNIHNLIISDPCYASSDGHFVKTPASKYRVGLIWANKELSEKENHGIVIFRAIN